ncbi:MAG: ATP-dependent sacrificial sulfur transferase LarE [Planctomycetes bacterium]|nr:ATP-dependent sacrificial sulfur transferase LarE [Planctomycetota bacterium]
MNLTNKTDKLHLIFQEMESVVVGYSGGIDSTLVARMAHSILGSRALAVIADSESLLRSEFREAVTLAESLGIPLRVVRTQELANPQYASNPLNRCYFCKDELFTHLAAIAQQEGYRFIADGANQDDLGDYRPGLQAAAGHQVRHPLQEAGLSKADIRELARSLGLPNWDKPAMPCLSSRFSYGTEITAEKLAMVGAAEEALKARGFRNFRVRYHEAGSDRIARLELSPDDFARLADERLRTEVDREVRKAGYRYVTLDLQGFRSGRLNDVLPLLSRFGSAGALPNQKTR